MDNDDTLEVNDVELTKKAAKNLFTPPANEALSITTSHNIDGTYLIKSVDFDEHQISLDLDGRTVKALTKFLDEKTQKHLYDIYKQADLENRVPRASLWIVAEIRGYELIEAAVTGIGEKRDNTKKLKELLTPPNATTTRTQATQLKLY